MIWAPGLPRRRPANKWVNFPGKYFLSISDYFQHGVGYHDNGTSENVGQHQDVNLLQRLVHRTVKVFLGYGGDPGPPLGLVVGSPGVGGGESHH